MKPLKGKVKIVRQHLRDQCNLSLHGHPHQAIRHHQRVVAPRLQVQEVPVIQHLHDQVVAALIHPDLQEVLLQVLQDHQEEAGDNKSTELKKKET